MRSKLAVFTFVVMLFSLADVLAQQDSEPEGRAVAVDLRREIAELKQRIAELEAKLARLEAHEKRLLRDEQRMRRIDGWERLPGSYLRFPPEVERAMMLDPARLPRKLEKQMQMQPFAPHSVPEVPQQR